jgi:antitoxin CptB
MAAMLETREAREKRLLWRCRHRGIREMDILLGGFAEARLPSMTAAELDELEQLVETPDHDLLAWVQGGSPVPPKRNSDLLGELLSYRP